MTRAEMCLDQIRNAIPDLATGNAPFVASLTIFPKTLAEINDRRRRSTELRKEAEEFLSAITDKTDREMVEIEFQYKLGQIYESVNQADAASKEAIRISATHPKAD